MAGIEGLNWMYNNNIFTVVGVGLGIVVLVCLILLWIGKSSKKICPSEKIGFKIKCK